MWDLMEFLEANEVSRGVVHDAQSATVKCKPRVCEPGTQTP